MQTIDDLPYLSFVEYYFYSFFKDIPNVILSPHKFYLSYRGEFFLSILLGEGSN